MGGKRIGEIYILRFPNGKCYVGQTERTTKVRFRDHCQHSSSSVVGRAIKKYGKGSVQVEVLARVPLDMLDETEKAMIIKHGSRVPSGYNIAAGGEVFRDKETMTMARIGSERFQASRKEVQGRESTSIARRQTCMAKRKAETVVDVVGREYRAWRDAYKNAKVGAAGLAEGSERDPFREVAAVYGEGVPCMPGEVVQERAKAKMAKIGEGRRNNAAHKRWEYVKDMDKAAQQSVISAARRNAIYVARKRTPDRLEQVVAAWEEEWAWFESRWAELPDPPASSLRGHTERT